MIRKNIQDVFIPEDATIISALGVVSVNRFKTGFIVKADGTLYGAVSEDGLIQGLLNGKLLDSAVKEIANTCITAFNEGEPIGNAYKLLDAIFKIIPVVDIHGKLTGYIPVQANEFPFCNIRNKKVVIIGLGYVGLTLALILAEKGFSVTGFDVDKKLIDSLRQMKAPFFEKGISRYITNHVGNNLLVTNNSEEARGDIYIITVGTPIDRATKKPRIEHVEQAVTTIAVNLSKGNLVVLRSTVPLGVTRENVIPVLEKSSGLKVGEDFYLAYCPERSIEGSALEELPHIPQIIAGYDRSSAEMASRFFNEMTATIVDVGELEAAELCKIMDNTFRDILFSYSNQMAEICEKTGLDFDLLVDAVNLKYGRNSIKKPSPGVGGPCLSKDPYILLDVCRRYGIDAPLIKAGREVNEWAPEKILFKAEQMLVKQGKNLKTAKIFIVGFAFKGTPETSDMRDSTTLHFLTELKKYSAQIYGYDPVVPASEILALGVEFVDIKQGFLGADAIFVMNNHKSYEDWNTTSLLETTSTPCLFYDAWRIFDRVEITSVKGIIYTGVGCA